MREQPSIVGIPYGWIRWAGTFVAVLRLPSLLSGDPVIIALCASVAAMWAIHWIWPT